VAGLLPRLALAGAIALTVSFIVSYFISRSISGPLVRITQASRQMASGDSTSTSRSAARTRWAGCRGLQRHGDGGQQLAPYDEGPAGNVSHELKTPLTSIRATRRRCSMARSAATTTSGVSRIIHEEANRMRALVDDLLLLSQIESGQPSCSARMSTSSHCCNA
jgi:signal transduction histidine kinase